MNALGTFITGLLAIPAVRLFLEDVLIRIWAEMWSKSQDPQFKSRFLSLSDQLASAETEDKKREILQQIRALRSHSE